MTTVTTHKGFYLNVVNPETVLLTTTYIYGHFTDASPWHFPEFPPIQVSIVSNGSFQNNPRSLKHSSSANNQILARFHHENTFCYCCRDAILRQWRKKCRDNVVFLCGEAMYMSTVIKNWLWHT